MLTPGAAKHCVSRHGFRRGKAGLGRAWQGAVRRGGARQGYPTQRHHDGSTPSAWALAEQVKVRRG